MLLTGMRNYPKQKNVSTSPHIFDLLPAQQPWLLKLEERLLELVKDKAEVLTLASATATRQANKTYFFPVYHNIVIYLLQSCGNIWTVNLQEFPSRPGAFKGKLR